MFQQSEFVFPKSQQNDLHLVDSSSKLTNLLRLNPKYLWLLGFYSKHASHNSFSAPTKLVPLSDQSVLMFPHLAMKRLKACISESASNELVTSMWAALLAIQVNNAPHLVSSDLLSFILNGQNITTPQWVNGGSLETLSFGKSNIFCSPNLPLSLRHTTNLCIKLLMAELALTIQKPHCLNSFNVRPLPPCATFLWHHLMIASDMQLFFGSSTGWAIFASSSHLSDSSTHSQQTIAINIWI